MADNRFQANLVPAIPDAIDAFTRGYLEAAEFTDCHSDNPELYEAHGFSPEFIGRAVRDCAEFQRDNAAHLERYYAVTDRPEDHAGHDFWLTRNGHGAGFWDRGDHPVLWKLTNASHGYGPVDLYAGDDKLIYGM